MNSLTTGEVTLSGPWWNNLTYLVPAEAPIGGRLWVEVNRRRTVGILRAKGVPEVSRMKVATLIDNAPVLTADQLNALDTTSRQVCCSAGLLAEKLLPPAFFSGGSILCGSDLPDGGVRKEYFHSYDDRVRLNHVLRSVDEAEGSVIILVPSIITFELYNKALSSRFKDRLVANRGRGGSKFNELWNQLADKEKAVVLTLPSGAVLAPLKNLVALFVEEESSGGYSSQGLSFNYRDLAINRMTRGKIVLLDRCPSAYAIKGFAPTTAERPEKKPLMLDLRAVQRYEIKGFEFPLPLSNTAVIETGKALVKGETVIWILDRRAYAGVHRCVYCGESVNCPTCDAVVGVKNNKGYCPRCGATFELPTACPHCGSQIMQFRSPGLPALAQVAQQVGGGAPLYFWQEGQPSTAKQASEIVNNLKSHGGLVLATRRGLELLSLLPVSLVLWVDGDGEARRADYAATFQAYKMVLESLYRGDNANRKVFIQTRQPFKGWQRAITRGWSAFWNDEVPKRAAFGFPPFTVMAQLTWPKEKEDDLIDALEESGCDVNERAEGVTIIADSSEQLYKALEPRFNMKNSRKKFPTLVLRGE